MCGTPPDYKKQWPGGCGRRKAVLLLRWARLAASSRFLRGRGGRVVRAVILVPEKVPEKVEIFGELCGFFGQFRRLRDKLA